MNQAATSEHEGYQTGRRGAVRPTHVGVVGAGTVGGALVGMLRERPGFELVGVVVRDPRRPRAFAGWQGLVTDDASVLDAADVVVEVAGGTDQAADVALAQLAAGKRLVTANKAALAERWDEFLPHMEKGRVYFEAAVMAGTPAVGVLAGALRGSAPTALHAVLNGTCNFILGLMDEGASYAAALEQAQGLGYAEADPTLDVTGIDAAHKLTLLGRLAFDPQLAWDDVRSAARGIADLTPAQLAEQAAQGRRVRLVASVVALGGAWRARVRPVALPLGHPLLTQGAANAMLFVADPLGEVLIRGQGAGGGPTASGVLADLLAAARGDAGPRPLPAPAPLPAPGARAEGAGVTEL